MGTDSFVQQNVSGTLAGGRGSESGTVTGIASSRDKMLDIKSVELGSPLWFSQQCIGKASKWGDEAPSGICKTGGGFGPE